MAFLASTAAASRGGRVSAAVAAAPRFTVSGGMGVRGVGGASSRRREVRVRASSDDGGGGASAVAVGEVDAQEEMRLRLHNLTPFPGSTKKKKRVGRGYAAGQGGSCGRGMRGQKSRSGRGIRPGFEGGQSPLYRRIGKLKGIAGNNKKGMQSFNVLNVGDLDGVFEEDEEVTRASLIEKGVLANSGKKAKRPVKLLGEGDIGVKLNVKVSAVSSSAMAKLEAAGCNVELVKGPQKWTRALHKERLAAAAAGSSSADGDSK